MNRVDAEAAVIGACLIDPQGYWRVADMLSADDFSTVDYRGIWEAIGRLCREGVVPDFVTVGEAYRAVPMSELLQLANTTPGAANVRGYAKWVLEAAIARRINVAGQRIAKLTGPDTLGEAQRIIASCQPRAMSAVRTIRSFLQDSVQVMQQRCDATDILTGVQTSLEWLDEMTSGWQRGDLVIIAARPSVGKTALAIQCALHAAKVGHPVFFASLEQSGTQLAERAIAHCSGVSLQHITQPKRVEPEEWTRITNAGLDIENLPIQIDETGALTVESICARARQCNAEKRLGLIVIDYLTQITPPKAGTVAEAVQVITRTLKAMAKELSVPVILLSQLNRDGDDKPILKNLRDSGAIEQDADVVLFLHRPDPSKRELIELIIAKQRNGPCDSTYLHAAMDKMRFLPTEERPQQHRPSFNTFASRSAA